MENNLPTLLASVKARLAALGDTHWKDAGDWSHDCRVGCSLTEGEERDDEAADLIAHAPTDLRLLLAITERADLLVRTLRMPGFSTRPILNEELRRYEDDIERIAKQGGE